MKKRFVSLGAYLSIIVPLVGLVATTAEAQSASARISKYKVTVGAFDGSSFPYNVSWTAVPIAPKLVPQPNQDEDEADIEDSEPEISVQIVERSNPKVAITKNPKIRFLTFRVFFFNF